MLSRYAPNALAVMSSASSPSAPRNRLNDVGSSRAEVDVVRAQLDRDRREVGDDAHDDFRDVRRAAEVRGVRFVRDALRTVPAHELVRARPDRMRVEVAPVQRRLVLEQVARQDAVRRVRFGEHAAHERRERLLEMEHDGIRIGRLHALDAVVGVPVGHRVARVHDRAPRERDVGAGERRAVVPAHAAPQRVADRLAVGGDPAVAQRRHVRGEIGHEPPRAVLRDQQVEAERREPVVLLVRRIDRVEAVRIGRHGKPQRRRIRPRVQRRRAARDRGARAEHREQREEREQRRRPCGPAPRHVAERVRFELTVRYQRTPAFEAGAFNHSTTSPRAASVRRTRAVVRRFLPRAPRRPRRRDGSRRPIRVYR